MASVSGAGRLSTTATKAALETMVPSSTFLSLLEYDAQNMTLTSYLKSGAIYQHKMFFPLEWVKLQTTQNHGKEWASSTKGKISVRVKKAKAPRSEMKHKRRMKP
jgi:hypothetical protein